MYRAPGNGGEGSRGKGKEMKEDRDLIFLADPFVWGV